MIDSDKEARPTVSIQLKLDSKLEELLSEDKNRLDDAEIIQAGFSIL